MQSTQSPPALPKTSVQVSVAVAASSQRNAGAALWEAMMQRCSVTAASPRRKMTPLSATPPASAQSRSNQHPGCDLQLLIAGRPLLPRGHSRGHRAYWLSTRPQVPGATGVATGSQAS